MMKKKRKATIEFLGLWEKLYNPDFKGVEFDAFAVTQMRSLIKNAQVGRLKGDSNNG